MRTYFQGRTDVGTYEYYNAACEAGFYGVDNQGRSFTDMTDAEAEQA